MVYGEGSGGDVWDVGMDSRICVCSLVLRQ